MKAKQSLILAIIFALTLTYSACDNGDGGDGSGGSGSEGEPNTVATPTATPPAGNYSGTQNVTLSTTAGASIFYTLNGDDPTASSTPYSGAINISAATTLKAIAVKDGMIDSGILTAAYTITPVSCTVTFNSNGGSSVSQITGLSGGNTISKPTDPTKSGYDCLFDGWYKEEWLSTPWNFASDTVTASITLYAKWKPYAIGDTGPGGGIIFYRSEAGFTMTGGSEAYYLEAAPADMETKLAWATEIQSNNTMSTGTAIGTGRNNTAYILAFDPAAPAALACKNYNNNGKTDWFLPSGDELNELCINKNIFGNLDYGYYWSSSQGGLSNNAMAHYFFNDSRSSVSKTNTNSVRAVRAF